MLRDDDPRPAPPNEDSERTRLDPFIVATGDAAPRDQRDLMERPFFSLAKRPRTTPILYRAADVEVRRAHVVHPVTAVQTEYSLWTRDVETEILPTCRELGIGFVAYSPLGRGFLTGRFQAGSQFEDGDFRASLPRFASENAETNGALVELVRGIAAEQGCTPAQVALAWLLAKGDDIVPIPGTKRVKYLEENVAATAVTLSETARSILEKALSSLPVSGERYTAEGMKGVNA